MAQINRDDPSLLPPGTRARRPLAHARAGRALRPLRFGRALDHPRPLRPRVVRLAPDLLPPLAWRSCSARSGRSRRPCSMRSGRNTTVAVTAFLQLALLDVCSPSGWSSSGASTASASPRCVSLIAFVYSDRQMRKLATYSMALTAPGLADPRPLHVPPDGAPPVVGLLLADPVGPAPPWSSRSADPDPRAVALASARSLGGARNWHDDVRDTTYMPGWRGSRHDQRRGGGPGSRTASATYGGSSPPTSWTAAAGPAAGRRDSLAARFAAKEATIKVLRAGRATSPPGPHGGAAPRRWLAAPLRLRATAAALAEAAGITSLSLSMTHEGPYAAAVVFALCGSPPGTALAHPADSRRDDRFAAWKERKTADA